MKVKWTRQQLELRSVIKLVFNKLRSVANRSLLWRQTYIASGVSMSKRKKEKMSLFQFIFKPSWFSRLCCILAKDPSGFKKTTWCNKNKQDHSLPSPNLTPKNLHCVIVAQLLVRSDPNSNNLNISSLNCILFLLWLQNYTDIVIADHHQCNYKEIHCEKEI